MEFLQYSRGHKTKGLNMENIDNLCQLCKEKPKTSTYRTSKYCADCKKIKARESDKRKKLKFKQPKVSTVDQKWLHRGKISTSA